MVFSYFVSMKHLLTSLNEPAGRFITWQIQIPFTMWPHERDSIGFRPPAMRQGVLFEREILKEQYIELHE